MFRGNAAYDRANCSDSDRTSVSFEHRFGRTLHPPPISACDGCRLPPNVLRQRVHGRTVHVWLAGPPTRTDCIVYVPLTLHVRRPQGLHTRAAGDGHQRIALTMRASATDSSYRIFCPDAPKYRMFPCIRRFRNPLVVRSMRGRERPSNNWYPAFFASSRDSFAFLIKYNTSTGLMPYPVSTRGLDRSFAVPREKHVVAHARACRARRPTCPS